MPFQYQPVVPASNTEVMVGANVFANSKIWRNQLVVSRRRLYEEGTIDPLSETIAAAFRSQGFAAEVGVTYDGGEIDVLVEGDGILFAFECKNSLLPTGWHELLTSWDYVQTAAKQLNRFQEKWTDTAFRESIADRTGWRIEDAVAVKTGIIVSNRMFMGLRISGHPVRGSYECEQFITEGVVHMGDECHSFWIGDSLTSEDVRRYLEEDITYQPMWQAMRCFWEKYEFSEVEVHAERMFMDLVAVAENLGFPKAAEGLREADKKYAEQVKNFSLEKVLDVPQQDENHGS